MATGSATLEVGQVKNFQLSRQDRSMVGRVLTEAPVHRSALSVCFNAWRSRYRSLEFIPILAPFVDPLKTSVVTACWVGGPTTTSPRTRVFRASACTCEKLLTCQAGVFRVLCLSKSVNMFWRGWIREEEAVVRETLPRHTARSRSSCRRAPITSNW